MVSSLQVLTLEDWEIIMTDLVAATNWWAALYLLAWILIGHFIVLTLFLAVILEAFESMYDVTAGKDLIIAEIDAQNSVLVPGHGSTLPHRTPSDGNTSLGSDFYVDLVTRQRSQVWQREPPQSCTRPVLCSAEVYRCTSHAAKS